MLEKVKCQYRIWVSRGNWGDYFPCSRWGRREASGKFYCNQHARMEIERSKRNIIAAADFYREVTDGK